MCVDIAKKTEAWKEVAEIIGDVSHVCVNIGYSLFEEEVNKHRPNIVFKMIFFSINVM